MIIDNDTILLRVKLKTIMESFFYKSVLNKQHSDNRAVKIFNSGVDA